MYRGHKYTYNLNVEIQYNIQIYLSLFACNKIVFSVSKRHIFRYSEGVVSCIRSVF